MIMFFVPHHRSNVASLLDVNSKECLLTYISVLYKAKINQSDYFSLLTENRSIFCFMSFFEFQDVKKSIALFIVNE